MDKNTFYYFLMSWQFPILLLSLFLAGSYRPKNTFHRCGFVGFLVIGGNMAFLSFIAFLYGIGATGIDVGFRASSLLFFILWGVITYGAVKLVSCLRLAINDVLRGKKLVLWLAWFSVYPAALMAYGLVSFISNK